MRKVAFISKENEPIQRVMVYEEHPDSVYVFVSDSMFDKGQSDYWYESLEEAELAVYMDYEIKQEDWIEIADPCEYCQHDLILPIRVKGRDKGKPQWGTFEILLQGEWKDYAMTVDTSPPMGGMTGNERLWFTGLLFEFEEAKEKNKKKARKILEVLQFDPLSIQRILNE